MKEKLQPLWVFAGGMILALAVLVLLPTIGTEADRLAAASVAYADTFWLWTWVTNGNVLKFAVFMIIVLSTLIATGKAFLRVR